MKSDIYEYAWGYLEGKYSLEEAKKLCFYRDAHLAKRQMTWFKRNPEIYSGLICLAECHHSFYTTLNRI